MFCANNRAISWNELFAQYLERFGSTKEEQPTSDAQYVFVDPKSQHLLALVERLATKAAVLLQGQTAQEKKLLREHCMRCQTRATHLLR